MKVLHVTAGFWPATEFGGPIGAITNLLAGLVQAGVEVDVVATNGRGWPDLPRLDPGERLVDGVHVWYCETLGKGAFHFSPEMWKELWRRVGHYDLIHLHGLWTFPVAAAATTCLHRGAAYVITPHGSLEPWPLRRKRAKKLAYLALLGRRVLRGAAAIHYTTEHERTSAPALVRRLPCFVVPNSLEVDDLAPLRSGDVGKRCPRVMILGRIAPKKGFDLLLPAMAVVRRAVPEVALEVVGPDDGGYRRTVMALAARHRVLDITHFSGMVDKAGRREAFARASLLVAPSYGENFCMSAAEAMAAGLPVVLSNQVGLHDVVAAHGAGLVVEPRSSDLAEAIVRLLSDRASARTMGAAGRALATSRFSQAAVGAAMATGYRRLLGGARVEVAGAFGARGRRG